MPPLAPPADQKAAPWPRHPEKHARAAGALARRPASFHGRGAAEQQRQHHHLLRQRPRTQPDLLAGVRGRSFRGAGGGDAGGDRRTAAPSKVLVTVAVQRSMWPLHVMARAEWRVADLVAAAVQLYVREGRRPLLPSADPSAFGLHYSQFSLQSLDPEEKLMELGSRSFFLCPKAAAAAASSTSSSTEATKVVATSTNKPNALLPWLGFVHFWPLLV